MKSQSESQLVTACLHLLQLRGVLAWRVNTTGVWDAGRGAYRTVRGQRRGVSDILGIAPDGTGRLLAVEVKTATGRLSPEQAAFLDDVRARGGVGLVVRSVGELIEALDRVFGPG